MIDTAPREPGILEVLAQRARAASDTRLTVDAAAGLLAVIAIALWRGPAWYFLLGVALGFCAYGVWGICDRELRERESSARARPVAMRMLRAGRVVAAITGIGVAIFLMMIVLGRMLGTIIS